VTRERTGVGDGTRVAGDFVDRERNVICGASRAV
jgi:hypothetical protein